MSLGNSIPADIDNSPFLPIKEGGVHGSFIFSESGYFQGAGGLEFFKGLLQGNGLGFFSHPFRSFQVSLFFEGLESLPGLDVGDDLPPELGSHFGTNTIRLPANCFGYGLSMTLIPDHITLVRAALVFPGVRLPISNPGMLSFCPFNHLRAVLRGWCFVCHPFATPGSF